VPHVELADDFGHVKDVVFSPDGKWLVANDDQASGCSGQYGATCIHAYDAATGRPTIVTPLPGALDGWTFTPDGRTLIAATTTDYLASGPLEVTAVDLETGRSTPLFVDPNDRGAHAFLAATKTSLFFGALDGNSIDERDVVTGDVLRSLPAVGWSMLAVFPDSGVAAVRNQRGVLLLRSARAWKEAHVLAERPHAVVRALFHDGCLAVAFDDGAVMSYPLDGGTPSALAPPRPGRQLLAVDTEGRAITAVSSAKGVRVTNGVRSLSLPPPDGTEDGPAASSRGLVAYVDNGRLAIADLEGGSRRFIGRRSGAFPAAGTVLPDGTLLFAAGWPSGELAVWDLSEGHAIAIAKPPAKLEALEFDENDGLVARTADRAEWLYLLKDDVMVLRAVRPPAPPPPIGLITTRGGDVGDVLAVCSSTGRCLTSGPNPVQFGAGSRPGTAYVLRVDGSFETLGTARDRSLVCMVGERVVSASECEGARFELLGPM
jgi:WD40 repeat protein